MDLDLCSHTCHGQNVTFVILVFYYIFNVYFDHNEKEKTDFFNEKSVFSFVFIFLNRNFPIFDITFIFQYLPSKRRLH